MAEPEAGLVWVEGEGPQTHYILRLARTRLVPTFTGDVHD